jgi:hypothetical protein
MEEQAPRLPDGIVRLNVGGKVFVTRKAHLCASPFFDALFRFEEQTHKLDDGCFFVDRNPKVFQVLLELFRTGVLFWENEIQLRAILIEADYFLISEKVLFYLFCCVFFFFLTSIFFFVVAVSGSSCVVPHSQWSLYCWWQHRPSVDSVH